LASSLDPREYKRINQIIALRPYFLQALVVGEVSRVYELG